MVAPALQPYQRITFIDLVDAYQDQYPASDPNGVVGDVSYGPAPTLQKVRCYRQTKKEGKEISPVGQILTANIDTTDVFHFALGIPITSNWYLRYVSILSNGQKHPDYGMWFSCVGVPQPLTIRAIRNVEIYCKREPLPPLGVVIAQIDPP